MPFLQEQKTVTGADLFRHLELENTDATLVFTNNITNILFVALAMNYFRLPG